tara:strand:- start:703 stop:1641 length:939 start_codon:yes stop_codon:yes gene_type:complete
VISSPQASGSTAVNLSKLPFPEVVETLSIEAIIAEAKAELVTLISEDDPAAGAAIEAVLQLESEPLVKLIEIFALREFNARVRVNDSAKACMIAYAVGADLDNLGALVGVERLEITPADPEHGIAAVMEGDEALRRRILLAPEAYSVAGPAGAYVSHALDASADVLDASATSPTPGQVLVTVLSRLDDGAASPELLAAVEASVSSEEDRPLTDEVIVAAAEILTFTVQAEITTFSGPDSSVVLAEADARLTAYLAGAFRLGRDITRSAIITALSPEGVQDVDLTMPAANIPVSSLQAARCTAVELIDGGLGE